jgi:hypothetical protein
MLAQSSANPIDNGVVAVSARNDSRLRMRLIGSTFLLLLALVLVGCAYMVFVTVLIFALQVTKVL